MAKVWFVWEDSDDPTRGEPEYTLPLEQCIEQLGLAKNLPRSSLDRPPRFDGAQTDLPRDPRHVFCQVDEPEASEHGWEACFYRLDLSPKEVRKRLGPPEVG